MPPFRADFRALFFATGSPRKVPPENLRAEWIRMIRLLPVVAALLVLLSAMMLTPQAARAAESYQNCTGIVTSVPAVISTEGTWCLQSDLSLGAYIGSGNAIDIQSDNVTLDCNGFKLVSLGTDPTRSVLGVHSYDRSHVTVRHCDIRGFFTGVYLQGALATSNSGNRIEDNRLDGNIWIGIRIIGNSSVIRRNRVFDTHAGPHFCAGYGIVVDGANDDVMDNTISGVVASSGDGCDAYGIYTMEDAAGSVVGNRIRGVVADGIGASTGIRNDVGDRLTMRENDLVGNGAAGSIGVLCGKPTQRARDNTINGFASGLAYCSDDGGNTIAP